MKRDLKIWAVIVGIILAGMGITKLTDTYVSNRSAQMELAGLADARPEDILPEAAEEPEAAGASLSASTAASGKGGSDLTASLEETEEPEAALQKAGEGAPDGGATLRDGLDEAPGKEPILEGGRTAGSVQSEGEAQLTAGSVQEDLGSEEKAVLLEEGAMAAAEDSKGDGGAAEQTLAAGAAGGEEEYRLELEGYLYRLPELDVQIQQMRSTETDNTVQSVRSAVRTEQRIWERELEAVYALLIVSLDEKAADELRAEQQAWIIERDAAAQEASKKNSGSMENVEYTASIAASTRDRVYQLVERYR